MRNDLRTLTRSGAAPHADEIRWTLLPLPRLEDVNWLELTEAELWDYVRELREDLRIVRELLHAALAELFRLTEIVRRQTELLRKRFDLDGRVA